MKKAEKNIMDTTANESSVTEKKPEKKKRSFPIFKILIALVLVVAFFYFGFTCEVREGECALILRFGRIREEVSEETNEKVSKAITDAGLYLKWPAPFETVVKYDNRLQYLETNFHEVITADKRNVLLQFFVAWQIEDPVAYHNSVGKLGTANNCIKDQVFSATNTLMSKYNMSQLVSLNTEDLRVDQIQSEIFNVVKANCSKSYGISIQDVCFLKISLPDNNLQSVFDQMTTERQVEIDAILAEAEKNANKITSEADAEAAAIIAGGITSAAEINAKTEKEVARIYAEAQAANLELFKFLKQLDTFVSSVGSNTVLVVKADEYPFNVLTQYGDYLTDESDETIIQDLGYILTQLPEADREALISAISELIEESASNTGGQQ